MVPRRLALRIVLAAAFTLGAGGPTGDTVAAESWSRSITVAAPDPNLGSPAIAIGRQGAAVAAWTRGLAPGTELGFGRVASGRRVFARYRRPGASFGPAIAISPAGADADTVRAGIDDRGRALLLWERATVPPAYRSSGSKGAVYLTRLVPGRRPVTVRLSPRGVAAASPALAVAPDGSAVAAWWETTSWGIFGSVRHRVVAAAGTTAGAMEPRPLSAPGAVYGVRPDTSAPSVAMAASGAAAVAWRRMEAPNGQCCVVVEAATLRPATGFGPVVQVARGTGGEDAQDVRAAVASDGSPRVVWRRPDSPYAGGCCSVLLAWAPGSTPALVTPSKADIREPVALGLAGDRLAVGWIEGPPGADSSARQPARVRVAVAAAGVGFAGAATLSAHGREADDPRLAAGPDGVLVAAWARAVGTGSGDPMRVEAATAAGGPFGLPRFLSRATPRGPVRDLALSSGAGAPVAAIWRRAGRVEATALGTGLGVDPVPDYTPPRLAAVRFGTRVVVVGGRRRAVRDVLVLRASEPGTLEIVSGDSADFYSAQPGAEFLHERTVVRLRRGLNVVPLRRFLAPTAWVAYAEHFIQLTPRDRTGNVGTLREVDVGRRRAVVGL